MTGKRQTCKCPVNMLRHDLQVKHYCLVITTNSFGLSNFTYLKVQDPDIMGLFGNIDIWLVGEVSWMEILSMEYQSYITTTENQRSHVNFFINDHCLYDRKVTWMKTIEMYVYDCSYLTLDRKCHSRRLRYHSYLTLYQWNYIKSKN